MILTLVILICAIRRYADMLTPTRIRLVTNTKTYTPVGKHRIKVGLLCSNFDLTKLLTLSNSVYNHTEQKLICAGVGLKNVVYLMTL